MATSDRAPRDAGDFVPIVWTRYEDTPADMRHEHDVDRLTLATAEVWAAHLALVPGVEVSRALAVVVVVRGLTGQYIHEPSYLQWCEPEKAGPKDPDHLVLYFRATNRADAHEIFAEITARLGPGDLISDSVLTTAGDWSAHDPSTMSATPEYMVIAGGVISSFRVTDDHELVVVAHGGALVGGLDLAPDGTVTWGVFDGDGEWVQP